MYGVEGLRGARLPDLVFLFSNVSEKEIHVQIDECSLIDFKLPQPISINTFSASGYRNSSISTISGTMIMNAVGPHSIIVPPGQNKTKSYSISVVDAPDRHERKSVCRFHIGNGTILQLKDVDIDSQAKYISQ